MTATLVHNCTLFWSQVIGSCNCVLPSDNKVLLLSVQCHSSLIENECLKGVQGPRLKGTFYVYIYIYIYSRTEFQHPSPKPGVSVTFYVIMCHDGCGRARSFNHIDSPDGGLTARYWQHGSDICSRTRANLHVLYATHIHTRTDTHTPFLENVGK